MAEKVARLGSQIYQRLSNPVRKQRVVLALSCLSQGVMSPIECSRVCIRMFLQEHPFEPCPGFEE